MKYPAERRTWIRDNPIRTSRIQSSLCSKEVAYRVGVSSTGYRRWECGMRRPTIEHMEKLASVLSVEPITLIERYELWRALKP